MKEEKDILFVGIESPVDTQRTLLESSKSLLENMHRFENYKVIRKEKLKTMHELNIVLKDVNKMIGKLKSSLPKVEIKLEKKKGKKKVAKKQEPSIIIKPKKRTFSEIEKIENELKDIEDKLNTLS